LQCSCTQSRHSVPISSLCVKGTGRCEITSRKRHNLNRHLTRIGWKFACHKYAPWKILVRQFWNNSTFEAYLQLMP
jgi:hypothetical protein